MHTMARHIYFTFVFIVAIIINIASKNADAYSCGDPSSNHCYGTNAWSQTGEFFGAYSDIKRGRMTCPGNCGGFIDNEIWLIDESTADCVANKYRKCWVEAGLISDPGAQDPVFFWADFPPNGQFALNLLGPSDAIGVIDHFMIIKDGRVTPNTFLVFIYNDGLSTLYNGKSIVPTGNPMTAKTIIIGQELAGSQNAFADDANFFRNIWAVQALGPEYRFWYAVQVMKGSVRNDNPPSAKWTIDPGPSAVPEGGQFTTNCCM
jgi:hypothetical protein